MSRWGWNSRFLIGKPGNPMMERWRLVQTPLFGLYVHRIYREDLDPVPHDHPWRFWSLILRGGYSEEYHADVREIGHSEQREHRRGVVHGFPLGAAHRITAVQPRTTTLVLVGRKVRTWGFYDWRRGNAFVEWQDGALGIRPTEGARSTGKYPKGSTGVQPEEPSLSDIVLPSMPHSRRVIGRVQPVEPAGDDQQQRCPHMRPSWRSCPHCLGVTPTSKETDDE